MHLGFLGKVRPERPKWIQKMANGISRYFYKRRALLYYWVIVDAHVGIFVKARMQRAKEIIPNDKAASKVLVEVPSFEGMMDPMILRSHEDVLQWPKVCFDVAMNHDAPKLIEDDEGQDCGRRT